MNVALSSDFPSTKNPELVARMRTAGRNPRIAWLASGGASARLHFPLGKLTFLALGFSRLERVDLADDQGSPTEVLAQYDVVYLSGGDPVVFRQNLRESGYDAALRAFAQSGRLIVGASGGAMQLTRNISLYRLLSRSIDEVVSAHARFDGLGLVDYELLPHLNRHDAEFEAKVQQYSERMVHDIVALADGAVVFADAETECRCCGDGVRYRRGVRGEIGAAA